MVRAAVVARAGAPVEIAEVEPPPLGPGDVRVRVAVAGVCHSDLSMVDGTLSPPYPLVPGHEATGVVEETGTEASRVRPGDRVVLNWAPPCRRCWHCLHAEPWLCARLEGVTATPAGRLAGTGEQLHATLGVGAFAEEVVLAEAAVLPLPPGVPLDLGALLGCAVLTGVGAVRNTSHVRAGESVAVFGLGGVGLAAVLGARLVGADPVLAIDRAVGKRDLALRCGASEFLEAGEDTAKRIRAATGGRGADHTFECVGSAPVIRLAWQSARRGGRCTVVGIGRRDDRAAFGALELFHFARSLSGSVFGSSDPERDLVDLGALVAAGRLDPAPLATHRGRLDDLGAAFERMRRGEGARTLLEIGSEDRRSAARR